jgi:hypothetical protein
MSTMDQNREWTQVLANGKQFLPLLRHLPGNSYIQDVLDTTQINTNNINKTSALLQTTRGKDEPNIVFKLTVVDSSC